MYRLQIVCVIQPVGCLCGHEVIVYQQHAQDVSSEQRCGSSFSVVRLSCPTSSIPCPSSDAPPPLDVSTAEGMPPAHQSCKLSLTCNLCLRAVAGFLRLGHRDAVSDPHAGSCARVSDRRLAIRCTGLALSQCSAPLYQSAQRCNDPPSHHRPIQGHAR